MTQEISRMEHGDARIIGIDDAISPARLIQQITLIQDVMKTVMKDGEHFGKIPGCGDKPSLLKPGAEKLCFTFRLDPEFDVDVIDLGKWHREYRVKSTLYSINGGARIGSGVGSASTMETKWRYRTGPKELTDKIVPKEYWDNRETDFKKALSAIGGKGFSVAKGEDGKWYIAVQGERVEHDNPADNYNTCLKMAKKRAMVDAVLTCTAASDIFTQDVEELVDNEVIVPKPAPSAAPKEAGQAPAAPPPDPLNDPREGDMRDELVVICDAIAAAKGPEWDCEAVLRGLTAYGKFMGYAKMSDIPLTKPKKDGTLWNYLETTLSKARKVLEEMKDEDGL